MPKLLINGVDLHYQEQGKGPTVVLCHGVGGNHLSWWQQVPVFARYYHCITFDQRGFFLSENTETRIGAEAFADDLAGLLDHLGIDQVFLVGQSMGGRTVVNFAKRFPHRTRAMVLAGSVANIRSPELDLLRKEARARVPKDRLQAALSRRVWEERPQLGYLYTLIRMQNGQRPREFLWRDNVPGTTVDELADLATPCLFIVGEEDLIAPPWMVEAAHRHFPNADLIRVPQAGHSVYFENPTWFNNTVISFFERHR